jgi:signal peptide peptidase SppA
MWRDLVASALVQTWAIRESVLNIMLGEARLEEPARRIKLPKVQGNVAILPIHGVIQQRGSIWDEMFGGTSTQALGASFVRAINDDRVGAVVFDVDSPGGTTSGVEELADLIHTGSQRKPVVAVSNSQMASAAYWLSSQVGAKQLRLVASPGADAGSIGVFMMHQDVSEAMATEGVKVTIIQAGKYKTETSPFEPLSDEAREHLQTQVDATYDTFVNQVARGRGVAKSVAKDGFGQGRMYHAQQAAELGLIDRVATMGRVLDELGAGTSARITKAQSQTVEDELCQAWESGHELVFAPLPDISVTSHRLRMRIALDKRTL